MYIDRIRIDWDKVSPDSYLTRIPAIGLLQELSEQVANFAESAVTKLRSQHSIALEMVVFAITNRFKENAPQTYASKYVVIPDGKADHRTFIRHALEGCRDFYRPGYGYKKAGVVITRLVQEEGFAHSLFSDM